MASIFRNQIRSTKQKALREHLSTIQRDNNLDLHENHSRTEIKQPPMKDNKTMRSTERIADISQMLLAKLNEAKSQARDYPIHIMKSDASNSSILEKIKTNKVLLCRQEMEKLYFSNTRRNYTNTSNEMEKIFSSVSGKESQKPREMNHPKVPGFNLNDESHNQFFHQSSVPRSINNIDGIDTNRKSASKANCSCTCDHSLIGQKTNFCSQSKPTIASEKDSLQYKRYQYRQSRVGQSEDLRPSYNFLQIDGITQTTPSKDMLLRSPTSHIDVKSNDLLYQNLRNRYVLLQTDSQCQQKVIEDLTLDKIKLQEEINRLTQKNEEQLKQIAQLVSDQTIKKVEMSQMDQRIIQLTEKQRELINRINCQDDQIKDLARQNATFIEVDRQIQDLERMFATTVEKVRKSLSKQKTVIRNIQEGLYQLIKVGECYRDGVDIQLVLLQFVNKKFQSQQTYENTLDHQQSSMEQSDQILSLQQQNTESLSAVNQMINAFLENAAQRQINQIGQRLHSTQF